jgi:hypothetical protein
VRTDLERKKSAAPCQIAQRQGPRWILVAFPFVDGVMESRVLEDIVFPQACPEDWLEAAFVGLEQTLRGSRLLVFYRFTPAEVDGSQLETSSA